MKFENGTYVPDIGPDARLKIDNTGAIALANANGPTKRTKHLDVRYHYIQQQVQRKVFAIDHVNTENQLADPFTKTLGKNKLMDFADRIGFAT